MYKKILKEIISNRNIDKSVIFTRFFKTGKEEYGEGDLFLGIIVPISRKIAIKYGDLELSDISKLLNNKYHEVRLIALLILVHKYQKLCVRQGLTQKVILKNKRKIVDFYLAHTKYINNWDLVDLSAHYTVGDFLHQSKVIKKNFPMTTLIKLAKSENLWERRIAIISTFAFIYKGEYEWTFRIVKMLMKDKQDLIHKACGWMLREVGKRVSEQELILFLDIYGTQMPRTMLRYTIERLPEKIRLYYLNI